MRQFLLLLTISLQSIVAQDKVEYTINGSFENNEYDGKTVYLYESSYKLIDNKIEHINTILDSALIANKEFTFTAAALTTKSVPMIHTIQLEGTNMPGWFVPEKGTIYFNYKESNPNGYGIVGGTSANDALCTQIILPMAEMMHIQDSIMSLRTQGLAAGTWNTEDDMEAGMKLLPAGQKMLKEQTAFIKENINSPAAHYILITYGIIPPDSEEDIYPFLNEETKAMVKMKEEQMKKLTAQMRNMQENIPEDVKPGKPYIDFQGKSPDNETLQFSAMISSKKLVLIDFWASWCMPCMKEMPHVAHLYEEYREKGLEIVGISIDKDEKAWKGAIEKNSLTWPQLIDTESASEIYGVTSIPCTLLIDQEGIIVARNLRGKELEQKIAEILQ